jgi:hypothetical protein
VPAVILAMLAIGATARAQAPGNPVGPFKEVFAVAGSLDTNGAPGADSGVATDGWLLASSSPPAPLADGSFLLAQEGEPGLVTRVTPDGRSVIVAGHRVPGCVGPDCSPGPPGDGGPAIRARLRDATAVAAMPDGGFLIADRLASVVRRVTPDGIITTVAGGGDATYHPAPVGVGGPAVRADLSDPRALAVAPDGRFYIADSGLILRVDLDGILRLAADLRPSDGQQLAVQPDGGVLILDSRVIWRLAPDGHIATFAHLRFAAVGLVALLDGAALTIDRYAKQVVRVAPGGDVNTLVPSRAFRDFAGREPSQADPVLGDLPPAFVGLAMSPAGLLVATATAVLLAPVSAPARLMVRIRGARVAAGRSGCTSRAPRWARPP